MGRTLVILEVSRKQDYIFSSKKLRDNALRSAEIHYVTSSTFFDGAASGLYREKENLVYAGGGHTVLQFSDTARARRFVADVTEAAMRRFPGMELFAKIMEYEDNKQPGDNLKTLSRRLEEKKALRQSSFYGLLTGLEVQNTDDFRPKRVDGQLQGVFEGQLPEPPEGMVFPTIIEDLMGAEDNFYAVVHIDGNAMGSRVSDIYQRAGCDWNLCCQKLRTFSEGIQCDFEQAFSKTVDTLLEVLPLENEMLPIRPIILAGDDVCFVTAGSIGLECARIFLQHLTAMKNEEDEQPYAACAGVALVHGKYPFHEAYTLSEALCSNAKMFGAELDENSRISAMDWHIEFGQLKGSLNELRKDYDTEDGNRMELRPVVVVIPDQVTVDSELAAVRNYAWFCTLCRALQGEQDRTARRKLKDLRIAMKQGIVESQYFLRDRQISQLLEHTFEARYRDKEERWEKFRRMLGSGETFEPQMFWKDNVTGTMRCLYFDAVELIDHWKAIEEA